jgi:hypothetical protein
LSIVKAGDNTALSTALHPGFSDYPLKVLAPLAAVVGLLALGACAVFMPKSRSALRLQADTAHS